MFEQLVEALLEQAQRVSREQARLLTLVHQVINAAPDPRFGVDEVAFALSWTRQAAAAQEQLARQLIVDLPEVFAALAEGRIDVPKARTFADVLSVLKPEVARAVAAEVLPVAGEKTTAQLRDRLHRKALAADPSHARKRRERGITERRVILEPAIDGTATISAIGLPPHRAAAAFERITAIAKAHKLAGSPQSMDQLRTNALLDLLEGVDIGAIPTVRRGVVELTVGLETLAGLNDNAAALAGYGPVAADIARQCARSDYQWRFSVVRPETGELMFQGLTQARPPVQDPSARFPNTALARWVGTRDRTCRAKGCRMPARSCDIDHTVDFGHGGLTAHDNLALLCRRHHVMKHEGGWQLHQTSPGRFVWISPHSRIYHVGPEPP
ncbi:MAG TPA: HNH endonuclease [Micromonosporaceae bacterium]|nr:HNH endonuclease [Micromonosporaceae bacterium]